MYHVSNKKGEKKIFFFFFFFYRCVNCASPCLSMRNLLFNVQITRCAALTLSLFLEIKCNTRLPPSHHPEPQPLDYSLHLVDRFKLKVPRHSKTVFAIPLSSVPFLIPLRYIFLQALWLYLARPFVSTIIKESLSVKNIAVGPP